MLNHYIQVIHTNRCARGLAMRSADNVLPEAWAWDSRDGSGTWGILVIGGCDMDDMGMSCGYDEMHVGIWIRTAELCGVVVIYIYLHIKCIYTIYM